jgi:hypothetical protein
MRQRTDLLHLKLLNKIRTEELVKTSKKHLNTEPIVLGSNKKTPIKLTKNPNKDRTIN